MNQALVSLGILLKDSSEHDLPGSLLLQLLHVLVNELVLINKLENFPLSWFKILSNDYLHQRTALSWS